MHVTHRIAINSRQKSQRSPNKAPQENCFTNYISNNTGYGEVANPNVSHRFPNPNNL